MRKVDYEILAAAIKKHRDAAVDNPGYAYGNAEQAKGAKDACEKIACTFARFANVKKDEFLAACGIK